MAPKINRKQSGRITVNVIRTLCFAAAICVAVQAFAQEPARQTMKMGSKEWAELEKTLWNV